MNFFKKLLVASSLMVGAAALVPQAAQATVVNFDSLTGSGVLANGYGGINWNGSWNYYDSLQSPYTAQSGKERIYSTLGLSNPGVAFNFIANSIFQGAFVSGHGFEAVSFDMYMGGILKATSSVFNPSAVPTFLASGYNGSVDKIVVHGTSGGFFVLDDVTYASVSTVPVPAAIWLMLTGVAGLAGIRRARA